MTNWDYRLLLEEGEDILLKEVYYDSRGNPEHYSSFNASEKHYWEANELPLLTSGIFDEALLCKQK